MEFVCRPKCVGLQEDVVVATSSVVCMYPVTQDVTGTGSENHVYSL